MADKITLIRSQTSLLAPPPAVPTTRAWGITPARAAVIDNALRAAAVPALPTVNQLGAQAAQIADANAGPAASDANVSPVGGLTLTSGARVVGPLARWQMNNHTIDAVARIGLPIVAFLAYRGGHTGVAIAAAAGGGLLWANRLTRINL
jgi:hypothetical protein